jgi:hypothetical protein
MENKSKRQKWLHLRVTDGEYNKLQTAYKRTTCRILSTYLRDVLFRQPITVYYRNRSTDEFATVAVQLKNEMKAIGTNFNQMVKKVNASQNFDELGSYLFDLQMMYLDIDQTVKQIGEKMLQIYTLLEAERDHLRGRKVKPEDLASTNAAAADQQGNKFGLQ